MADASLLRLLAWMSPGFPVGAFSYSHGIEYAVATHAVHNTVSLQTWIEDVLERGGGRADAVLFSHAWRAARMTDTASLREVAALAAALRATPELGRETTAQGSAFLLAADAAWPAEAMALLKAAWSGPIAYPIAVAVTCAGHGISLDAGLAAYLHGFAANLVSAGVRLIPLGQTQGQRIVAALESPILRLAEVAPQAPLASAGSGTWMVDWSSMQHETLHTRLFRS